MATWYDIKLSTLKKIDPAVTSLAVTRNTKDYLNAIVPVANRGLQDLATAGKFIIKSLDIMVPDVVSIIDVNTDIKQHLNSDIEVEGGAAQAFYFEISGKSKVDIYVGETLAKSIETTSKAGFQTIKGVLDNAERKPVKIVFSGSYPYLYRSVALYDILFENDEEVWEYAQHRRYDLRKITDDFFRLVTFDVVREGPYEKYSGYEWEGDSVLVLDGLHQGVYKVHYYAYPQEITNETPDDTVMALDPEVANLLPVYMASELYEDDDESKAFYFRQQYEEAKQKLIPTVKQGRAEFEDVWGWT